MLTRFRRGAADVSVSQSLRRTAGGSAEDGETDRLHYLIADRRLGDGWILDDGCGHGNGTLTLARPGRRVVGIDPDWHAIRLIRSRWESSLVEFLPKSSAGLPFGANVFDGAVSFEVLEHIQNQEQYLDEIARVLKVNASFLLSTPNRRALERFYIDGRSPVNITHIRELSPDELLKLLQPRFELLTVCAIHATDLDARETQLRYSKSFPIPYAIRAHVPWTVKSTWLRLRRKEGSKGFEASECTWRDVLSSDSLFFEDLLVECRKKMR
jgi:SAM-dependent methyltransferase